MATNEIVMIIIMVVTLIVVCWAGWHTKKTGDLISDLKIINMGLQARIDALGETIDWLRSVSGYKPKQHPKDIPSYNQILQEKLIEKEKILRSLPEYQTPQSKK